MRIFLGVTGASGALYAAHALRALTAAGCEVGLCASEAGVQVVAHEVLEIGVRPKLTAGEVMAQLVARYAEEPGTVELLDRHDLTSAFASGSSLSPGALVAPCSMSTLAAIAHGTGTNLIHRCADVMLKEGRRLVLIPRETPLGLVHLENMLAARRAGATVLPAMPGFYGHPRSVDEMVDFVVGKALDQLGVPHALLRRWGTDPAAVEAPA
jgi:4-hydroxy-3-polyprenylbenzoate decarboxylase